MPACFLLAYDCQFSESLQSWQMTKHDMAVKLEKSAKWPSLGCSLYGKKALNFKHIKSCESFIVRRLNMVDSVVLHIENFTPRWKILGGKI